MVTEYIIGFFVRCAIFFVFVVSFIETAKAYDGGAWGMLILFCALGGAALTLWKKSKL